MSTIHFFLFLATCILASAGLTYVEILYKLGGGERKSLTHDLIVFTVVVGLFCVFCFSEYCYFHRSALGTGWSPIEKALEIVLHMAIVSSWILCLRNVLKKNDRVRKIILHTGLLITAVILIILNTLCLDSHYQTNSKYIELTDISLIMAAIIFVSIIIILHAVKIARSDIPKKAKYFFIIESILIIVNFAWNNFYTLQLVHQHYIFIDSYSFGDLDVTPFLVLAMICLSIMAIRNSVIYYLMNREDVEGAKQFDINNIRKVYSLTPREAEVLELLIRDASYAEICSELNVTINTVKKHVNNLYRKVDVASKSELFKKFHP